MPGESIPEADDALVKALVALDEGATVRQGPTSSSNILNNPEQQARLERARFALEALGEFWPREEPRETGDTLSALLGPLAGEHGRFRIIGELGHGGWGIVFLAEDRVLGRRVALKVPRPEVLLTSDNRKRFLKEAKIAARLNHAGLIPLFDAGESGPFCYLVSAYCDGPTLASWLAEQSEPVDCQEAARLVAQLAEAVAYMHEQGVLHRDLKPGNILLANAGRKPASGGRKPPDSADPSGGSRPPLAALQPKITDFGLAAFHDAGTAPTALRGLTHSGALIGTPAYMAPEQAAGHPKEIGPKTDVYALGAVLYELLTGKPPFTGESDLQTRLKVINQDPPRPRALRSAIPLDLETICLKCLERAPGRRYGSARDLVADLRAFDEGRPIQARPIGKAERAWRWTKRRPSLVAVGGLVLTFALLLGGAAWLLSLPKIPPSDSPIEKDRLMDDQASRKEYLDAVRHAADLLESGQTTLMAEFVKSTPVLNDERHTSNFECRLLRRIAASQRHVLKGHSEVVNSVAFSRDGRLCASSGNDGKSLIWDVQSGQQLQEFHFLPNADLAFSADGMRLISCGYDPATKPRPEIVLWDVKAGTKVDDWQPRGPRVQRVVFSKNGKYVAVSNVSGNPSASVYEYPSGKKIDDVPAPWTENYDLDFCDNDQTLAIGYTDTAKQKSGAFLYDLRAKKVAGILEGDTGAVYSVKVSPDGSLLALGSQDKTISIWDLATRTRKLTLQSGSSDSRSISFSHDSRYLVARYDGKPYGRPEAGIRLWGITTGQIVADLGGPSKGPHGLAVSTIDDLIAFGGDRGPVYLWDTSLIRQNIELAGHQPKEAWCIACAPDGKTFATSGDDGNVKLWNTADGKLISTFHRINTLVSCIAFSPDSRTIAAGDYDHQVVLWNVKTGKSELLPLMHKDDLRTLAFSPDGKWLASGGHDGAKLYDLRSKRLFALPKPVNIARSMLFTQDSKTLLYCSQGTQLGFWDPASGKPQRKPLQGENQINAFALSSDGKLLATGDNTGVVQVWDFENGSLKTAIPANEYSILAVAFSPNGKTLATAGGQLRRRVSGKEDSAVKLWDPETGRLLLTLKGSTNQVNAVAFSPDGSTLISADHDGIVRMWKTDANEVRAAEKALAAREVTNGKAEAVSKTPLPEAAPKPVSTLISERRLPLYALAAHPKGEQFALGFGDGVDYREGGAIEIRDSETGDVVKTLHGHKHMVNALVYRPDGKILASGTTTGSKDVKAELCLWDVNKPDPLCRKPSSGHYFERSMAFSHKGNTLAAIEVSDENEKKESRLTLWDVSDPKDPICNVRQPRQFGGPAYHSLTFSPDDRFLLIGVDGAVEFWDIEKGEVRRQDLESSGRPWISLLQLSPGLNRLAAGSYDGRIWIYDAKVEKCHGIIDDTDGPLAKLSDLSFDQDLKSTWLAAASGSNVVLCDWSSRTCTKTFTGHIDPVTRVIFLKGKNKLVSCGLDGKLFFHDLHSLAK
jgi:WD40 repeat protein/predicted Ser/Thr protein kinase